MHCHSKPVRTLTAKSASVALSFLLLAACSSSGQVIKAEPGARRTSAAVEAALCEGRPSDAQEILSSEPLAGPVDRFYTALALEKSGLAISARKLYAGLMQSGSQQAVFLRCGDTVIANGTVADESAQRLAALAQKLRAMDVAPEKPTRLPTGLPRRSPVTSSTTSASYSSSSPMAVYRPQSTSPLGQWFAHLESYKTYQSALDNKPILEKKFPELKGYIDQWEVSVAGGVVRLGIRLDNKDDARRLCNQIKSNGSYCAVLDTSG